MRYEESKLTMSLERVNDVSRSPRLAGQKSYVESVETTECLFTSLTHV